MCIYTLLTNQTLIYTTIDLRRCCCCWKGAFNSLGPVTHMCTSEFSDRWSFDNLSSVRRQAVTWTNTEILLRPSLHVTQFRGNPLAILNNLFYMIEQPCDPRVQFVVEWFWSRIDRYWLGSIYISDFQTVCCIYGWSSRFRSLRKPRTNRVIWKTVLLILITRNYFPYIFISCNNLWLLWQLASQLCYVIFIYNLRYICSLIDIGNSTTGMIKSNRRLLKLYTKTIWPRSSQCANHWYGDANDISRPI